MFNPYEIFKYPILGRIRDTNWDFICDLLRKKVVLDTQTLKDYIHRFTGDMTFKEIFTKNGWNLNITVTDFAMQTAPRLLNYLTAPNVLVWSAVCASCAIPGIYAKVDLMQKLDDGSITQYDPSSKRMQFVDGSVAQDLPMRRLTELFNVNTFIVSQVNPHVCPFVNVDRGQVLDNAIKLRVVRILRELLGNTARYLLRQMTTLGLVPRYIRQIAYTVEQSYKGHVTVVPSPTLKDYTNLLVNLTPEIYYPGFQASYVQSLRKMAHIKSYFAIEREFDRYYDLLKA